MESCTQLGDPTNVREDYCEGGKVHQFLKDTCPAALDSLEQATEKKKWCVNKRRGTTDINCHWSYLTASISGKEEINGSFPFDAKEGACINACERLGDSKNKRLDYCSGSAMWQSVMNCKTAEIHLPEDWCVIHGKEQVELQKLVLGNGGTFGHDLRLTLTWNHCDDLDLHLAEPTTADGKDGEHISWRHTDSRSSGKLDIDQRDCKGHNTPTPLIENINYLDRFKIGAGKYKAMVRAYTMRTRGPTEWTLFIERNGTSWSHRGKFTQPQDQQTFTFNYPYDGHDPVAGQVTGLQKLHSPAGRRLSATEDEDEDDYPIVHSKIVRTDTIDFQNDVKYQALSSVQTLPPPVALAEEGWNHSQCESAFNNSCWAKGRFVNKNDPAKSCCRDCAEEWSNDRCHWGWSSNLHGNLSGAFWVPFGPSGKACYHACMTIKRETFSALDFCRADGVLHAIGGCDLAVNSVTKAMNDEGWNTEPDGVCHIHNVSQGRDTV